MQLYDAAGAPADGCFYLSKRRQMQRLLRVFGKHHVVFTFQKEGRCNVKITATSRPTLFLPFKKKADATGRASDFEKSCCFYLSKRRQMQLVRALLGW